MLGASWISLPSSATTAPESPLMRYCQRRSADVLAAGIQQWIVSKESPLPTHVKLFLVLFGATKSTETSLSDAGEDRTMVIAKQSQLGTRSLCSRPSSSNALRVDRSPATGTGKIVRPVCRHLPAPEEQDCPVNDTSLENGLVPAAATAATLKEYKLPLSMLTST